VQAKSAAKLALYVILVGLIVLATYGLLRPPAPKPVPPSIEPPTQPAPVQPIPGEPQFDVNKYKTEPVISVWLASSGQITHMPLEKYLEGVVAQEMHPDWPLEALAAQAIASRTFTIKAMETGTIRRLHGADVSTSKDELQAYAPQKVNDAVREAVRKTRGQVLLYAGSLVHTFYSSCNGQIAATRIEAFPEEITVELPYLQPVTDNCFQHAPPEIQSWTAKIPASQVGQGRGL